MNIIGKNHIGHRLSSKSNETLKIINPETNTENSNIFYEATLEEVSEAANLAHSAFITFRNISGPQRARFLNKIADNILKLDNKLIESYKEESGLTEARAINERARTIFQLRSFAELIHNNNWRESIIEEAEPKRIPNPKPDLRKTQIPLGPVVVFGSSNFPLAYSTAGGDTASALASGCPVIVKAHEMHLKTSSLVAQAIIEAAQETGMPDGVFSHIIGRGKTVGTALVKHPRVKAVGFTGSISGGRALFDLAAQRPEPIPVFAEMGSINPVVITGKALKKRYKKIAEMYANSITQGTGQFCTNPGLILTMESDNTSDFIRELAKQVSKIPSQCMLHPNIKARYEQLTQDIKTANDLQIVTDIKNANKPNYADALIATVSGKTFLNHSKLHQEIFGPFSLVVRVANNNELLAIIEDLEGQLTGTIMAEQEEYPDLPPLIDALQNRVGRLIFNGVPTGVEVCAAMQHGGPYPASSDSRFTAVGVHSIKRWVRPVSYQSFPKELLPENLKQHE
ncbi:aldehyde dehydrogenase (NADP(+)) [Gaetbulibacter saemankumensis]|uniref:aldehyde dehydrogenase (NADP(+)) n=1 Tax=Gaetbulibacter saemankumensis TaxID=311208 RepID=UPI000429AF77|nr:aldehyde dehydrogenase (NADP(+)) [Gaetbulibacter saemankumensis]